MTRPVILLVEDNRDDVELTLHALQACEAGFPIVIANDGTEALDYLLCRGPYANRDCLEGPVIILLDLKLPRMDGIEVLKVIREKQPPGQIVIIALTTSDEEDDIAAAYRYGVNSYIRKPIDFDQFSQVMKEVGRYWLSLNTPPPSPRRVRM